MKKISNILLIGCCASSLLMGGCIDETVPTQYATNEQMASSAKATEALLWAMPAYTNKFDALGRDDDALHFDFGYGAMMHIRDVMGEDMAVAQSNYDQFSRWEINQAMGESYAYAQFVWNFHWKFIQTANNMISAVDEENATPTQLSYLGVGYAFRALAYLDMARMFEFLENDKISSVNAAGNDVKGLTVPIVTEQTTEEEARNNPRVPRAEMFDFILADLDRAEELVPQAARANKTLPDLTAVYGLKARLYMWVEDYAQAKEYARKAINAGNYTPTTQAQWLDPVSGFNDLSTASWIWGSQQSKEDDVVQTGIVNWTSWASNEARYGYAAAGPMSEISALIYEKIDDRDFRKLSWKAPEGSALSGRETYIDAAYGAELPEYASLKFRPGQGNMQDYNVGSATAYPLMRIEEMYFIEAEAAAHLNAAEGKKLLEDFMKGYRFAEYTCAASDQEGIIDEIFLQKRVELWGEGQNYFDYKRLNKPVTRDFPGTNFRTDGRFNTTTRPAWMNFCIVRSEKNNNAALVGYENPDPTDCYK